MNIDPTLAAALGFPKLKYTFVERERRWLCREVPRLLIRESWTITDLYVTGTRLRLREMRPMDGGPGALRLTRKVDVDAHTRLLSSIYLPEEEFASLAAIFPGVRLSKIRHRLQSTNWAEDATIVAVDEFQGDLAGLVLAEAEFNTDEELVRFAAPDFTVREVTREGAYSGGSLARNGIPREA